MSLKEPNLNLLVIAVLVKRLGGKTTITQREIDEVAYGRLLDTMVAAEDGTYSMELKVDFTGLSRT